MIQDIAPHRFDNHFELHTAAPDDYMLCFDEGKVLVSQTDNGIDFPRCREVDGGENSIYLFAIDGVRYFLALDSAPMFGSYTYEPSQLFRSAKPRHLSFAGLTAFHLHKWYSANKFCGRCGRALEHSQAERMLSCPDCGNMLYPQISPAVIIGVTDGDRLLLIKHAGNYRNFALVAGFAEVGETIEQTVAREVFEEVGLRVKNTRFYKSQPWALSNSLLLGFYTEVDGSREHHVDGTEVAEAHWFTRDTIPVEHNDFALTNEMIMAFKEGKQ